MIRVYLDWNAFSRLDDNDELYKKASVFLINDSKYIIPFSHAHLLDIHRSYLKVGIENIQSKLDVLQKYSKDLMITDTDRDELEFISPITVTKAMEMQIESFDFNKSLNIGTDDLLQQFQLLKPLLDFSFPNPLSKSFLANSEKEMKATAPRSLKIGKEFLGDAETISTSEIIRSLFKMAGTIQTDNKYNEIREAYQKDLKINTSRMRDKRFDPMEILDETARKSRLENFMALHERLISGNDGISIFKRVKELARHLDMNGFFSDVIKEGHHLDNIETDYNHIGYGSTCDIFISADTNTREKAKLAYKLLDIDVKVFTPKEFVEFADKHSDELIDGNDFLNFLLWIVEDKPTFSMENINYYYIPSYILGYFNVVRQPVNNEIHLLLEKLWSPNRVSTFVKEITTVRDKLMEYFGEAYHMQNELGDPFYAICWMTEDLILIKLIYSERSLKLEVVHCKRMKPWERFWKKCKQVFLKCRRIHQ